MKAKRFISAFLVMVIMLGMIPFSTLTANAASWDLKSGGKVRAGEVATITCYGGAAWQQTNVMFEADWPTMGYVTRYNKDGEQVSQRQICGSADFYDICVTGGETYVVETYVGAIEITYNTANTINPKIEVVDGGINMEPIVKTNLYPSYELYLTPGETSDLFIQWYYPGCYFELNPQSYYNSAYVSGDTSIVTIDDEGKVTALKEGETRLKIYFKFGFSEEKYFSTYVETVVHVVDDNVNKQTGIRYFYSHMPIEVGDTVQIGADYTGGDYTGMYYPGTIEWRVDNENVLSVVQPVDNITMIRAEALNLGECNLTLLLNGKEVCTEKIEVTISDDTMIKLYKDYLMNCGVMTTLDGARATCWEIIGRYSQSDITRIGFFSCLKSGLGLNVITKEAVSKLGLTSSTYDDTVDEALDDLLKDLFSANDKGFSDVTSSVKKKYKLVNSQWKIGSSSLPKLLSDYNPSFSEEQINNLNKKVSDFYKQSFLMVSEGITVAEFLSVIVFSVQYERDTIVTLMNTIAATPGGTGTDLYKGLERQLRKIDDLTGYAVSNYLSDKIVDKVKDLVKAGFFLTDENGVPLLFDKGVWSIAEGIGYIVSQVYGAEGGIFADDYMKACIASNFAATMYSVVKNSDSSTALEYSFKFYVSTVKNALNAAIDISEDPYVYCLDLKRDAEGYLTQIDQTCTYEGLLQQCRLAITNSTNCRSTVTLDENGEFVVSVYYVLPDQVETTRRSIKSNTKAANSNSFYDTGYSTEQIIVIPSHIDGNIVNTVADEGFKNITGKFGILIPDSVVKIGSYAFSNCLDVRYISLGSNLEYIGVGAFSGCGSLQTINLPNSLKVISDSAFENCSSLTSVNITSDSVGSRAFANCSSLSSVTFDKNISIASDAFDDCSDGLVIYGYKGTDAEKIASEKGFTFIELSQEVISATIYSPANKTEFIVGEAFTTDGLVLEITYADGTTELIEDGWVAYADTSSVGTHNAKIYYEEVVISYEVNITTQSNLTIELDSYHQDLIIGTGVYLHANISDLSSNLRIKWSSSNPEVASVDKNGYIEAYSNGTANIKAEVIGSDVSAVCSVTVGDSMSVSPANGAYIFFTVPESGEYVFYSKGSTRTAYGYIFDVAGNQLEKASGTNFKIERRLNAGVIYVLQTTSSSSNSNYSIYIQKKVPIQSVEITNSKKAVIDKMSGFPNERKSVDVIFSPDNYISEEYSFESLDETVATVSDNKEIVFNSVGTTKLIVTTTNGITDSIDVETLDYPEVKKDETVSVTNDDSDYKTQYYYFIPEEDGNYLLRVDTSKVSVTIYDENWSSLSIFNAYYSYNNGFGQASMTAGHKYYIRLENVGTIPRTYSFNIIKRPIAESVTITYSGNLTGFILDSVQLGTQFAPENCIVESCVWTSSDESVAKVNSSGLVEFVGVGDADISVLTENGLSDTCSISVLEYQAIKINEEKNVVINNAGEYQYFSFTPSENGRYAFFSISDLNTYAYLYDLTGTRLAYDSNTGEGNNFRIEYDMIADQQYVFKVKMNSSSAIGSFDVKLIQMVKAESISVDQGNSITGYPGDSRTLSVSFGPSDAIAESCTWQSSDESVATVNAKGVVNLLAVGETEITVTSESGLTDTCTVYVTDYPEIHSGDIVTVTIDSNGKNAYFKFTPEESDTYIFTSISNSDTYGYLLDSNGNTLVSNDDGGAGNNFKIEYTLEAGQTYIYRCRYYSSSATGSFDVELYHIVDAEYLSFEEGTTYIGQEGDQFTLTPKFMPNHSRSENVTWASSDESLATVDNGSVTLLNEGTATITATSDRGLIATCEITITGYERISVDETKTATISTAGERAYFKFVPETDGYYSFFSSANDDTYGYIYDVNMNQLASNDDGGEGNNFKVSYKMTAGTTYILVARYYSSSNTGSFDVSVSKAPDATAISITSEYHGYVGEYQYLDVNYAPYDAAQEDIVWTSSNENIVTVSSSGRMDFIADGEAIVTATTMSGLTASCSVTVSTRPVATAISITEQLTGYVGDSTYLSVSFVPEDSVYEEITWSSSDEDIVAISSYGRVSYIAAGTATITAESENGLTAVCNVTVIEPPTMYEDIPFSVVIENNERQIIYFTPNEDGNYIFFCNNYSNSNRAYISVYDSNGWYLSSGSRQLTVNLSGGVKYKIATDYDSYSGNGNGTYDLTVSKTTPATNLILLDESQIEVYVNTYDGVSVKFAPWNAMAETITWSSSDESVVVIEDSYRGIGEDVYYICSFKAVSVGTAIITATSESGLTAEYEVRVKDFESISTGETKSAVINSEGGHAYFSFTPDEDGYYAFYSNSDWDTYGYIRDEDMNQLAYDDDSGSGSNFKVKYQMTAGTTYILDARYYSSDRTGSFDVTIEQTKFITRLEIESLPDKMDYIKGFASGNLNYDGLILKATWSDDTTTIWRMNIDDYYIGDERVRIYDYSVDDDGIITISCGGQEVQYQLNLLDNPVSSLEVVQGTNRTYIENYGGYFTTWYNDATGEDEQVYYYYTNYPSDAVIKVNYNDGTSKTVNIGDRLDGYSVSWNSNQNNKPWHVGTDNESTVSYLGVTVNLPITVNANTVESIEVKTGTSAEYIENAYGSWNSRWDPETEEYDQYYSYSVWDSDFQDAIIQINYTDGSSKSAKIGEEVDGYWINWNSDQYNHPWTLGSENYLTVSYLGKETKLYVTVVANPVDYIEITSVPTRKYIYVDNAYGTTYSDGSYEFSPTDLTGLVLTVYYTDGTSKQFEPEGGESWGTFDGYRYWISYDGYNPEIGSFPVTFCYMGRTDDYSVVLQESPIASIEVTKLPDKTEYSEYYSPDWTGLELAIHNADGTTDTVTINSENSYYSFHPWIGNYFGFNFNGNEGYIEESWEGNEFTAVYMGQTCSIDGITFVDDKVVKNVELKNFTLNGTGTEVTVTFEDDSVEKMVLDDIVFRSYGVTMNHLTVYAKTNKGILSYSVSNAYLDDDYDEDDYYDVWIFGKEIRVDKQTVIIGDVNGDGEITSKDVTILRRYLAGGWNVEINEANSDINGDGEVTSKDVTLLRRYLAGGWGVELG